MDARYLHFCPPGRDFYDTTAGEADRADGVPGSDFPAALEPLPRGWSRRFDREWCYLQPDDLDLPDQGWKIHVSATPENAERVLKSVHDYCRRHSLLHKFLRSPATVLRRNSKYGDRSASGKFVTVFPHPDDLVGVLDDLEPLLAGEVGPTVLSDLRIGDGPLSVRYGAFRDLTRPGPDGTPEHCIRRPDGTLVPDVRKPGLHIPDWVEVPPRLQRALDERARGTLRDFPYRATAALHFSNGGGVYRAAATDTGETVLLKEARPYAGLDEQGRDAVERLDQEAWAMRTLAGLSCVPRLRDHRKGHAHWFLVRDWVDGTPLSTLSRRLNPEITHDSPLDHAAYRDWACAVADQVEQGLSSMHDAGVVFGDVHPDNLLVGDDNSVVFIDFESASTVEEDRPQYIGAPGFRAPLGARGVRVDRFGLGCLRLALFLPLTLTLQWGGPDKLGILLDAVRRRFDLPEQWVRRVVEDLGPPWDTASAAQGSVHGATAGAAVATLPSAPDPTAPGAADALVAHVLAQAEPDRSDRLFPGDIHQFLLPFGGTGWTFGAAGVLHTLLSRGVPVPDEYLDWFRASARRMVDSDEAAAGFGDGLAGVVPTLDLLGDHDLAEAALSRALAHPRVQSDLSLFSGLAGVLGVALDRNDGPDLPEPGGARLDALTTALLEAEPGPDRPAGLLHGGSGPALACLRLHQRTGDPRLVAAAARLVRSDLDRLGVGGARPEPPLPTWDRPTLGGGAAGVLLVLSEFPDLAARPDLQEAAHRLVRVLLRGFHSGPGMLSGQAGALLALDRWRHRRDDSSPDPVPLPDLSGPDPSRAPGGRADQAALLSLHLVPALRGTAVLGEHGLRLSCDWGTGAAGVLTAVDVLSGRPVRVPVLTPRSP